VNDRRVQKTRGLLHRALVSLIHEKEYESVVVKEILARANVGRSTFYAHFRDKGELLDTGLRDMLRACAARAPGRSGSRAEQLLRFSGPLFAHVDHVRGGRDWSSDARRQAVVHERLRQAIAELVADDLRRLGYRPEDRGGVPAALLAQHVASTYVLVFDWWMRREEPIGAVAANERFRELLLPTLAVALG
jgi:AcrR family transcriptional regulator